MSSLPGDVNVLPAAAGNQGTRGVAERGSPLTRPAGVSYHGCAGAGGRAGRARRGPWAESPEGRAPVGEERFRIRCQPELCTGCLRCALTCSDLHAGAFCPERSFIRVEEQGGACSVRFDEACTGCGACADSCFYDALSKVPLEVSP